MKKISKANKGRILTEERKIQCGLARKGCISEKRKKIKCIETGIIYDSLHLAAEDTNISVSNVCKSAKQGVTIKNKFTFIYY